MSYNKIIVVGHLGADPELRTLPSGEEVLRLRVAVSEKFKKRSGELVENTEWFSADLFGKRSRWLSENLSKGDKVLVDGKLSTSEYTDRNGEKRLGLNVRAFEVEVCGPLKKSDAQSPGSQDDDHIPF